MRQLNLAGVFGKGRAACPTPRDGRMMTNALAKGLTGTDSRAGIGIPDSDIVSGRRVKGPRDEAGAILIFALIFLVAVGGVVGSLASWATNDLNNTSAFTNSRTLQYAVSGAVDTAMQNIRYTPLLSSTQNANPPVPCWGSASSSSVTINGSNVDVWCSTVWTPSSPNTRVVTFSACPVTAAQAGQSASTLATSCAANPNLEAVVTFGDYPSGTSAPNTAECVVYCGTSMTVNSWIWSP